MTRRQKDLEERFKRINYLEERIKKITSLVMSSKLDAEDTLKALKESGLLWSSDESVENFMKRFHDLSKTERKVYCRVILGWTNLQVAGSMGVTEKTIKYHCNAIYRKLDVNSRAELLTLHGLYRQYIQRSIQEITTDLFGGLPPGMR